MSPFMKGQVNTTGIVMQRALLGKIEGTNPGPRMGAFLGQVQTTLGSICFCVK
jgi:hypothetical protein